MSTRLDLFFDSNMNLLPIKNKLNKSPMSRSLSEFLACSDKDFLDFLNKCLVWDPELRLTPEEGLYHKWLNEEYNISENPSSYKKRYGGFCNTFRELQDIRPLEERIKSMDIKPVNTYRSIDLKGKEIPSTIKQKIQSITNLCSDFSKMKDQRTIIKRNVQKRIIRNHNNL